jgi:hypothetical protein
MGPGPVAGFLGGPEMEAVVLAYKWNAFIYKVWLDAKRRKEINRPCDTLL